MIRFPFQREIATKKHQKLKTQQAYFSFLCFFVA